MQLTPWQFAAANGLQQVWTTNGLQTQGLQFAPNPIFIRGTTQADGSPGPGMFIQQNPQTATIQAQQNRKSLILMFYLKLAAKPNDVVWERLYNNTLDSIKFYHSYVWRSM